MSYEHVYRWDQTIHKSRRTHCFDQYTLKETLESIASVAVIHAEGHCLSNVLSPTKGGKKFCTRSRHLHHITRFHASGFP